ncbi:histidine phosphatase family protein [Colwelliaceae bacterium 6441]
MANIYLLRHGKVRGEAALYGHTDVAVDSSVDEDIIKQLTLLNLDIDVFYTSPLQRCAQLADKISQQYQRCAKSLAGLKEMNFGRYDGVAFDTLYQNSQVWQQLERFWINPAKHSLPHAEELTTFACRVINAWRLIVDDLLKKSPHSNILVVCHGGVIRMILAQLLNVDYRQAKWYTQLTIANGSLTTIEVNNGQCRVKNIAKPLVNGLYNKNSAVESNNELVDLLSLETDKITVGSV